MKKLFFILSLLISCNFANATQTNQQIDSLLKLLPTIKTDTGRITVLLDIADTYRSFETENALKYCDEAIELSKKIGNSDKLYNCMIVKGLIYERIGKNQEAIAIFNEIIENTSTENYKHGKAYLNKGNIYADIGKYDSSIFFYSQANIVFKKLGHKKSIAGVLNNIGTVHSDLGDFDKAIEYYTKALKIHEELGNEFAKATSVENIGIIYYFLGNNEKALEYFKQSLEIFESVGRMDKYANALNNAASINHVLGNKEESIKQFTKAEQIFEEMGHKSGQAEIAQNLASIHFQNKNEEEGLKYMTKSIILYNELNNPKGIGKSHKFLGSYYFEAKKYNLAITHFKIAKDSLEPLEVKHDLRDLYHQMATTYDSLSDFKQAAAYYKKFIAINDSIFNREKNNQIAEMQEKYDSEAKQREIELQQTEIEKQKAEAAHQTKQKIWFGIGLGLALVLLLVAYRGYRQKKQANQIITEQKAIVEEKNNEIKDSINYAKRIQNAIFPSNALLNNTLKNGFVLYQPKDIVAGDFYWLQVLEKEKSALFAVADCTGHGVPGAMVSVVCHNALNRAVREFEYTSPSKILDKVTEIVIETFEEGEEEIQDGMDIALCNINLEQNKLEYAGANNSLYLIRNNELIETKADKQPIGKYHEHKPFTNHVIELQKGDTIYLFSDGYADQFGGKKGKKFMYKPFKRLLTEIHQLPMEEQKKRLIDSFNNWKGTLEQVDDICIIGLRV